MNSLGLNKPPADTRVVVAMSGGVDSSVVAAMLKDEGYEITNLDSKHQELQAAQGPSEASSDFQSPLQGPTWSRRGENLENLAAQLKAQVAEIARKIAETEALEKLQNSA